MGAQLSLRYVTKVFGDVVAADRVSLDINQGEFLTLLGPSGSGKTTTLNMVAGFEIPTSGHILLEGQDITAIPPHQRGIGMVFQNYALFPHMTVFDNVAFPLKMRKVAKDDIRYKVHKALEQVQLPGFEKRYPNQLSGGQQQRIALARAIVFEPSILLMDEPLGALDKKLRDHMKLEIKHLQHRLNITVIYVTHDQEEALTMSDRIAIMNNGRIVQLGEPVQLYEFPESLFVADFIGESNFLEGEVVELEGEEVTVKTPDGLSIRAKRAQRCRPGEKVTVAVRPEKIQVVDESVPSGEIANRYPGLVEEVVYVGEASVYRVRLGAERIISVKVQSGPLAPRLRPGEKVVIGWRTASGLALN